MTPSKPAVAFTLADAHRAFDAWGANCGPGALAAVLGLSLDAVRLHLDGFDRKHYTNPAMMRGALRSLSVDHSWRVQVATVGWFPIFGLARVQWEGPWTKPGVPPAAAYRHTHWVGARAAGDGPVDVEIFDINCMCVGGWVSLREWSGQVVPWLLRQCEPKADGKWHVTHAVEIRRAPTSPAPAAASDPHVAQSGNSSTREPTS